MGPAWTKVAAYIQHWRGSLGDGHAWAHLMGHSPCGIWANLTESSPELQLFFLCLLSPCAPSSKLSESCSKTRLRVGQPKCLGTATVFTNLLPWHRTPGSVWWVKTQTQVCGHLRSPCTWPAALASSTNLGFCDVLFLVFENQPAFLRRRSGLLIPAPSWLPQSSSLRMALGVDRSSTLRCHSLAWLLAVTLPCLQRGVVGCGSFLEFNN